MHVYIFPPPPFDSFLRCAFRHEHGKSGERDHDSCESLRERSWELLERSGEQGSHAEHQAELRGKGIPLEHRRSVFQVRERILFKRGKSRSKFESFENRERWWEFIICVRFYRESCNVSTDRAADRAQRKYWLKIIISRRRFVSIVVYDIHDSVNYDSD